MGDSSVCPTSGVLTALRWKGQDGTGASRRPEASVLTSHNCGEYHDPRSTRPPGQAAFECVTCTTGCHTHTASVSSPAAVLFRASVKQRYDSESLCSVPLDSGPK